MTRLRSNELPKLYYPTPDELQGSVPLNENLWMREYQGLMLALANTSEGKDLLCIDDHGLPIIGIRKNAVCYDLGGNQLMADFRVGAKWGNVVRYRWQEVKRALNRMNELALLKAVRSGVPAGAATLTLHPDAHPESTTCDGYAATADNNTFSAMIAQDGATKDDSGTSFFHGFGSNGGLGTSFNRMRHAHSGFNTSALAGGTISAVTWSVVCSGSEDSLTPSADASLIISAPASNTGLVIDDFQNAFNNTTKLAADIAVTSHDVGGSTYTDFSFSATGRGLVVTNGVTNVGWIMAQVVGDDGSNSGAPTSGNGDAFLNGRPSEYTGTSQDVKLVVVYTPPPFTPKAIMF
jgi:hypothetical protein